MRTVRANVIAAMLAAVVGVSVASSGAGRSGLAAPATPPGPALAGLQRFAIVPGESEVAYRVGEVFIREGNRFNVAVGITQAVRGDLFIDRANPRRSRIGTITVDIIQFKSDSERRD